MRSHFSWFFGHCEIFCEIRWRDFLLSCRCEMALWFYSWGDFMLLGRYQMSLCGISWWVVMLFWVVTSFVFEMSCWFDRYAMSRRDGWCKWFLWWRLVQVGVRWETDGFVWKLSDSCRQNALYQVDTWTWTCSCDSRACSLKGLGWWRNVVLMTWRDVPNMQARKSIRILKNGLMWRELMLLWLEDSVSGFRLVGGDDVM
jgi:hypothetical protein